MNHVIIIVENLKVIEKMEKLLYEKHSYQLGPHCKNESQLSIIWQKVPAGKTITKDCPGHNKNGTINFDFQSIESLISGSVYRTCQRIEQIARWTHVNYSECMHPLISIIDQELEIRLSDKEEIVLLRDKCKFLAETTSANLTSTILYSSIDLILLIEQIERLTKILVNISHSFSFFKYFLLDKSFR